MSRRAEVLAGLIGLSAGLLARRAGTPPHRTSTPEQEDARFHISEASETFRFLTGLAAAVFGFLTGAAALLVVYGAEADSRPAIFAAAACMAVCLIFWLSIMRNLVIIAFVALRAERALGTPGIVEIYGRGRLGARTDTLKELTELPLEAALPLLTRKVGLGIGRSVAIVIALVVAALVVAGVLMPFSVSEQVDPVPVNDSSDSSARLSDSPHAWV